MDGGLVAAIVGGAVTIAGGPHVWRWLVARRGEDRASREQVATLAASQTAEIIGHWQSLAVASRERADALEARVTLLETMLRDERARHDAVELSLRAALANERTARIAAEGELDELRHRVSMLESYVATHAQLSVEAVSKGLMRALAERAPREEVAAIVADVASEMTQGEKK